jgi:mannan endo-1,4-beta-mannosidase
MKNKVIYTLLGTLFLVTLAGCGSSNKNDDHDTTQEESVVIEPPVIYEAEQADLSGGVMIDTKKESYSGTGYVNGFSVDEDGCHFQITIKEAGFYDFNFISASEGGYKENIVMLDQEKMGTVSIESTDFSDSVLNRIYLTEGEHIVSYVKYWGYVRLDRLEISKSPALAEDVYEVSAKLVNENAGDEAKRLMSYLTDIYGEYFLSGQYSDGMYSKDMACIWKENGNQYPAVLGLDLIEYTPSRVSHGSTSKAVEHAIEFWEKGGIVTFCWHWNAPEKYLKEPWYSGFYTEYTDIDLEKIMNGEDQEGYDLLMKDIDAIAKQLLILQEAGVPVLWRPLHEASGGWFWWGAKGAEPYLKLYKLLYERLTNEYQLNNLIWIWNGQDKDWYPGDEYVDVIGEDIYPGEQVYSSQMPKYLEALEYTDANKMIVLSENGCLFDPDLAIRDGAMWGFFATWSGEFVSKAGGLNIYSEQYTDKEMLKKVYAHEKVLTLDELPDLKTYEIKD